MAQNKYVGSKEAARLTGLKTQEIYDKIYEGKLPAHKAPKSGWRILEKDLESLGLIKKGPNTTFWKSEIEDCVSYIADEEHYTQVFKRMTEVKHSLIIATGDLKNFSVNVETDNGEETLRLCEFFQSLIERGIHVQVCV